jgi:membrane-associated phospholipid phosphatase
MRADHRTSIADVACSSFTGLLVLVTVICRDRVPDWRSLALQFATALVLYAGATWGLRKMRDGFWAVALRTAVVVTLFGFLFGAVANLQHVLVRGWMDESVLAFERAATGVDPTFWLQRYVHYGLTEIMMFAYVIYVPMLPGVALLCYRSAGAGAAYDYLLRYALVNIVCFTGFILFPVAGPLYHQPVIYTVPLDGGIFTWCGEWIRHNAQYAGGSLPSAHCAVASIMLAMLCRYDRKSFRVALPIVLILYVSTVYGRYHYASDAVAGILTALAFVSPTRGKGVDHERSGYGRHRVYWQRAR